MKEAWKLWRINVSLKLIDWALAVMPDCYEATVLATAMQQFAKSVQEHDRVTGRLIQ